MTEKKEIEERNIFYISITSAVDAHDVEKFKILLNSSDFSNYNKIEKEKTAFRTAYVGSEACLDYLIFEYKIEKHDTIQAFCSINEIIQKKFEMRDIVKDLPINNVKKKSIKM
jgi:hypothetical protein